MIPITAEQVKKVPLPDSEAQVHLRYPVGEHLDRFMAMQEDGGRLSKYRPQAEKNLKARTHGKDRKQQASMLAAEMSRLAAEAGDNSGDGFAQAREMVDIFVCGWEGKGWPEFPKDGKPSAMFKLGDLMTLAELVSEHIDDLTGIGLDEAKN